MNNIAILITRFLTNPTWRFRYLSEAGFYNKMPDEEYLKKRYLFMMGTSLNLNPPETFNEKIQYLKLHDRKPEYSIMVDKFRVRQYIADTLGQEYLIPLIGVYNNPDEIDFNILPEQFVLKCNHNSGLGACICRDKAKLDIKSVRRELWKGFTQNYYLMNREWPYKDVPHKIICEQYMTNDANADKNGTPRGLTDYKFYCFNGEPKYLYVSQGLEDHSTARISFLTMNWEFTKWGRTDYLPLEQLPAKPVLFNEMRDIAKKLSTGHTFLRVDLYEIQGHIYFGELTFSPCAGMMKFSPPEADLMLGKELNIKL